jgi:hypothetical protein
MDKDRHATHRSVDLRNTRTRLRFQVLRDVKVNKKHRRFEGIVAMSNLC